MATNFDCPDLPNGTQISFRDNEVEIITPQGIILWINTEKQDEIQISSLSNQVFVPYGDNCVVATNRIVKE